MIGSTVDDETRRTTSEGIRFECGRGSREEWYDGTLIGDVLDEGPGRTFGVTRQRVI